MSSYARKFPRINLSRSEIRRDKVLRLQRMERKFLLTPLYQFSKL
jgi:hypothetical protein